MMKLILGMIVTVLLCITTITVITFGFNYDLSGLETVFIGIVCGIIGAEVSK